MITDRRPGQSEAPLTTALGVFPTALVTFAREITNRDLQLGAKAFEVAQEAVEARLGGGLASLVGARVEPVASTEAWDRLAQ